MREEDKKTAFNWYDAVISKVYDHKRAIAWLKSHTAQPGDRIEIRITRQPDTEPPGERPQG